MAVKILTKWRPKWRKLGGKCVLAILWLSVRCRPKGNLGLYYFHVAGLLRGQNQPVVSGNCRCFTEIWPKMYITYVRF